MIKNAIYFIFVAAAALAIWRVFGTEGSDGDVAGFFQTMWEVLYTVIDAVAQILTQVFKMALDMF
jgi:hypothetical protein